MIPSKSKCFTGGNPFLVSEVIADMQAGRPPSRDPIHARIAALSSVETMAMEAAAVLGLEVSYSAWARLIDLPPLTLAQVADRLVAHGLLQSAADGYVFAHEIIRATVYDALPVRRRRRLHHAAAESLAALDANNWRARAFHLDRAGTAEEAARAYRRAGKQDQARFAFGEARAAFEQALHLSANFPTPECLETLFDLAQICDNTGDRARQSSALNAALHDAQQLENDGDVIRALLGLGRLAAVIGAVTEAEQRLNEALAMAERHSDHSLQFDATFYSGDLAARRGQLAEARTHFEQARQHAQLLGDSRREGRALRGLGIVARLSGDLPHALTLTEQALALQTSSGDLFGASVTQTNLLATLYELGAYDRLLTLADNALALKKKLGDRHGAAIVRHTQGLAASALGDFDFARDRLKAALQDFEAVQDRRTAGLARNVLGLVAESEGRLEEARQDFEVALASAQAVRATAEAAYAQHDLGALLLRLTDAQAAIPLLEAARAKWRESSNDLLRLKSEAFLGLARLQLNERSAAQELAEEHWLAFQRGDIHGEQPQGWLWAMHQLLSQLQRSERASAVLHAAYAEVQRQSEAITDDRLRRQFFSQVPLNRSIIEAHDRFTRTQRRLRVKLVGADVPLGRRLSDRDYVTIEWSIAAPDDDALADPIERRRHILKRLIAEARSANAAPTDADLARALGVSRRTIMRDIAALNQSGMQLPTRRRK